MISVLAAETPAAAVGGPILEMSRGEPQRFRWDFSRRNDENFDRWPDGWERFRGIDYPEYVSISIAPRYPWLEEALRVADRKAVEWWRSLRDRWPRLDSLPPSLADLMVDRYLRVRLDGGAAKVQSSPVETSRVYQYRFRCRIMTRGLRYDTARMSLVFRDSRGNELATQSTRPVTGDTPWTELIVDRIRPPAAANEMLVRLSVEGSDDGLEDIRGTIGFDDIVIEKFPQLQVTTDEPTGIYPRGRRIVASATAMGLPVESADVRLRLYDQQHRQRATGLVTLVRPDNAPDGPPSVATASSPGGGRSADTPDSADAGADWPLPVLEPGFYRVTASLDEEGLSGLTTETTFAVIDSLVDSPPHGCFGWTLPGGRAEISGKSQLGRREFADWLTSLGVAWVKYPCWLDRDDEAAAEAVAATLSRLQDAGIQTIGMLDHPPPHQRELYQVDERSGSGAAAFFREKRVWQPLLEPLMTRLTLKVNVWQLGADRDHSFLGRPKLEEAIREISAGLQGFGQPIDVALSWPWLEPQAPGDQTSWQVVCRSSRPELSGDELDAYLRRDAAESGGDGPRQWLLLGPIASGRYSREERIRDLVHRMASVRKHRVQAAFVSRPRDPRHGLLREDGRPAELLLPWRTTSRLIGDLDHVGSLRLRSGAENAVFSNDRRAVVMVWSPAPVEELIYLGPSVRQVDVWGETTELPTERYRGQTVQRVSIGPTPTFLTGVDPTLAAFRMSVELDQQQIDSILSSAQPLSVNFANPTTDSLAGTIRVRPPKSWNVRSETPNWELFRGSVGRHRFEVVLGNSAAVGTYELPLRFSFQTTPPETITVYRKVRVGPEGLDLKVTTRIVDGGKLRVKLEMTNRLETSQVYDCLLFPGQGRQYERRIVSMAAGETVTRLFYWPDGEPLVGRPMLLRAIEQDGRRVLNYTVNVER